MQDYQFHSATTVEEALHILAEKGSACKIIAGGTDLVPALRREEILPGTVLNILEIPSLKGIRDEGSALRVGPATTFTEIARSRDLQTLFPLLVEAASSVGGPTIRNRGTIGGNICNGSPAADVLPALVALDAQLELQSGVSGKRNLPVARAVEAPYRTRLRPDELLTGILLQKLPPGARYGFEKLAIRNAMARAYMNLSIVLIPDDGGFLSDVRIAPGALEAVSRRIGPAEEALTGKRPDEALLESAAEAFVGYLQGVWIPEYKLPVARCVFKRVLKKALNGI